jgi:hypothetical protein
LCISKFFHGVSYGSPIKGERGRERRKEKKGSGGKTTMEWRDGGREKGKVKEWEGKGRKGMSPDQLFKNLELYNKWKLRFNRFI